MAAKRTKRGTKRRSRAAKGRAKSRSGKRTVKAKPKRSASQTKKRSASQAKNADIHEPSNRQSGRDTPPLDYDEEDIEEYAELWGVSYEEAEAVLEESTDVFANVPLDDYGRPEIDYMSELADLFDVEVSDLYDLYYGYTPGSSE